MSTSGPLAMIAAIGPNLELGRKGDLIWHIPGDLKNFKRLTTGHPVIMGRKTWESLPKRPLPGRLNIVVSHSLWDLDGALCVQSAAEALRACGDGPMPFVIGGAQIYEAFLPLADMLYITRVDMVVPDGVDVWFPEFRNEWEPADIGSWTEENGIRYRFESWRRKEGDLLS